MPFAGWEMPVQYEGIKEEHSAVRTHAGMFDVSHMGEVEVEGPGALAFLQLVLSNDVAKLEIGGAQYSCLCQEDGGVIDDLFTYRLGGDRYLSSPTPPTTAPTSPGSVAGAASSTSSSATSPTATRCSPCRARTPAPSSPAPSGSSCRRGCASPTRGSAAARRWSAAPATPARTGSSCCSTPRSRRRSGPSCSTPASSPAGSAPATPCGSRSASRCTAHELSTERNPIEAGLGWCCAEATGFLGSQAVARARAEGTAERLAPFLIEGAGIPRDGNPVLPGDERVGVVTSGTYSPSLERGAGMAYVRADLAAPGTELEIDVRGKRRAARVASKPLYKSNPKAS